MLKKLKNGLANLLLVVAIILGGWVMGVGQVWGKIEVTPNPCNKVAVNQRVYLLVTLSNVPSIQGKRIEVDDVPPLSIFSGCVTDSEGKCKISFMHGNVGSYVFKVKFGTEEEPVTVNVVDFDSGYAYCEGVLSTAEGSSSGSSTSSSSSSAFVMPKKPINMLSNFEDAVFNLTNWLLYIVVIFSILILVWAGLNYVASTGNQDTAQNAKRMITHVVLGLLVAGVAVAFVNLLLGSVLKG